MLYQWDFRSYQRRFKQALQTCHGRWAVREGILLRLVDESGNVGWGEIAPIPWFGSETVEQALAFCHHLPAVLTDDRIFAIPATLPACQFGFESAWEEMRRTAIGKTESQRCRDAESQASFAPENSTFHTRNSTVGAWNATLRLQSSDVAVQNSALRPQTSNIAVPTSDVAVPTSDVAVQNSEIAVQNSEIAVPSSKLRPQNSEIAVQNSEIAVQNSEIAVPSSTLRPQNSDVAVQNSEIAVQNSEIAVPSSKLSGTQAHSTTPHTPHPTPHTPHPTPHSHSALLLAGEAALHAWKPLWEQGFRTFKWKIGVNAIATELEILHRLAQTLPPTAKLRLDANGGLSFDEAARWLETCDAIAADPSLSVTLEYLEQPLCVSQFQAMQRLSDRYTTPIALDESVATFQQLQTCYANGWRGVFVIKPAIVGSPSRLRQFCQEYPIDAVFSSAFETAIGRQAGLKLAAALGNPDRAVGYGTMHWFEDVAWSDDALAVCQDLFYELPPNNEFFLTQTDTLKLNES